MSRSTGSKGLLEHLRLEEARAGSAAWKKWGPYLSERQWGPPQARIQVPWDELRATDWRLDDGLSGDAFDRDGNEMRDSGLYVDLGPWQCHFFQIKRPDRP